MYFLFSVTSVANQVLPVPTTPPNPPLMLPNIKLRPQNPKAGNTQTIIKPVTNIIPLLSRQQNSLTLTQQDRTGFTFEFRVAPRAGFCFVFWGSVHALKLFDHGKHGGHGEKYYTCFI